jgi:hypothetical protein
LIYLTICFLRSGNLVFHFQYIYEKSHKNFSRPTMQNGKTTSSQANKVLLRPFFLLEIFFISFTDMCMYFLFIFNDSKQHDIMRYIWLRLWSDYGTTFQLMSPLQVPLKTSYFTQKKNKINKIFHLRISSSVGKTK